MDKEKTDWKVPQYGFFGHPKGLSTLFFTEMWERFSYYGMRAILVYYMYDQLNNGGLALPQSTAVVIMSAYGSLVLMSGVIGGWLADRLLGYRRSILYGGIFIMFGHIALSFPGGIGALLASMVLIIIGTGLLKPNVSTTVGGLYSEEDIRRDSGFSIFYMGINVGAFAAPYIAGTLGQSVNYHLGFSIAAIGMAFALIQYVISGRRNLKGVGMKPGNPLKPEERTSLFLKVGFGALTIILLLVILRVFNMLTLNAIVNLITALSIIIPFVYFVVMLRSKQTTSAERSSLRAYIALFIASMFFWVIDEQGSSVLAVFADQRTQLDLFGFHIPSSWFQSLNPIFTIILAPTFAGIWLKLGHRQPSTPRKFSIGLIIAGLSFVVMMIPAMVSGTDIKASPIWLLLSFFLVIVGSMCINPVGLSATTRLAPKAFSAQTMSLWFLSNSAAQGINAQVTPLYNADTEVSYFGIVGGSVIVVGIILFFITPLIYRYMKDIDRHVISNDMRAK